MVETHRKKYKSMEIGVFKKLDTNVSFYNKIIFHTLAYDNKLICGCFFPSEIICQGPAKTAISVSLILW